MPQIQQLASDNPPAARPYGLRGHEHGDLPVDDPPPSDRPSESYSAWRASAIYDFGPSAQFYRR
jgi:hypothetical protein